MTLAGRMPEVMLGGRTMWWMMIYWMVGPLIVFGGVIGMLVFGIGFGANTLAETDTEYATLKCFHCGRETSVGRKECEYCGKELQ